MKLYIDKKLITKFNKLNQDLKTVYIEYTILNGMKCVSNKDNYVMRTGEHYAIITDKSISSLFEEDVTLNSTAIYKYISNYKKYIEFIDMDGSDIICNAPKTPQPEYTNVIGHTVGEFDIREIWKYPYFNGDSDIIERFTPMISLGSDEVISLVKNRYKILHYDKFKTRITRELIPGLKKTHEVGVMFEEIPDTNLYRCIIKVQRDTVTTYHMYKCLYM